MPFVDSPYIWYPYGYPGSAYDLRKVVVWGEGTVPGTVRVRFSGMDTAATVVFNQAAFEMAINGTEVAPENTVAPTATGTAYVGYTLTGSVGTWTGTPNPTITYKWQRFTGGMWVDIPLATNLTYVVPLADEGVPLRFYVTGTNVLGSVSVASNAIEQFIPTDAPSVFSWHDAVDSSTITHVANGVSAWADKSGGGHTMTQATAGDRPTTNVDTINGMNVIRGDVDDVLRWSGAAFPIDVDVHIFVLCNLASTDSSIYDFTNVGNTKRVVFNDDIIGRANGGSIVTLVIGPTLPNGSPLIVYANQLNNGSNPEFRNYINGNSTIYSSGHSTAPIFTPGDACAITTIFDDTSGGDSWDGGLMGERVAILGSLTATNQQKIEGYLAWRWRETSLLPSGHPYKTVAPTP
jgi:hypothetical protein